MSTCRLWVLCKEVHVRNTISLKQLISMALSFNMFAIFMYFINTRSMRLINPVDLCLVQYVGFNVLPRVTL